MKTLLVGNGISNIEGNVPWDSLLAKIVYSYGNQGIRITRDKPFPLLYEEIYLTEKAVNDIKEFDLKSKIAGIVGEIEPNEIHHRIWESRFENIMTTNYDYTIQKCSGQSTAQLKNSGYIKEQKYSLFRHNQSDTKRFWHIHGEVNVPNSITLGYEHYGGQLQHLRNYVVAGSVYSNSKINNQSLYSRLRKKDERRFSWVDSFYLDEIHILGLRLGYEETDLWWLLTNRARFFLDKKNHNVPINKVIYYCPEKHRDISRDNIFAANRVDVKYLKDEGKVYYHKALDYITSGI